MTARAKTEKIKMTLGEQLRLARIQARLSQHEVANELGWSQTIISAYELDKKNPSFNRVKQLAELFKKYHIKVKFL